MVRGGIKEFVNDRQTSIPVKGADGTSYIGVGQCTVSKGGDGINHLLNFDIHCVNIELNVNIIKKLGNSVEFLQTP